MSKPSAKTKKRPPMSPVAAMLRARGLVPLPRLWVHSRDIPEIHRIAGRYENEVNDVRAALRRQNQGDQDEPANDASRDTSDPRVDKEAAWEAMERLRSSN